MLRTNLAQVLLLASNHDDADAFERARSLCEQALQYRSPQRQVVDWAYTMINLGAAIERLAHLGRGSFADADIAYRAVLDRRDDLPPELVGHARLNLLTLLFDTVARGDDEDAATTDDREDHLALVAELAVEVAENAAVPPVTRGRALRTLGAVHHLRKQTSEAIAAWQGALQLLEAAELTDVAQIAADLGNLLSELGRWPEAADAYRAGLRAADLLVGGPREAADRAQQAAAINRLNRWAAHAFVMCNELEKAVVTLENGRTRELRRQLQLEDPQLSELERLAPQAVAEWRTASMALASPGADVDVAGSALEGALVRIRRVPGFERFGRGADMQTIRAAADPNVPIVYVNPTPFGATLLRVDASGRINSRAIGVTGRDIVFRVLFGIDPPEDESDQGDVVEAVSYTLAAAGAPSDVQDGRPAPDIADALDQLLPWVGEHVAAAIDRLLGDHSDHGALLIPCGPLATVPLVAAIYGDLDDRCLLDRYVISATPSATAHAAAQRRAVAVSDPFACLVSVADPTDDLDYARVEVGQVKAYFAETRIAEGAEATTTWLQSHAADATVLHLACHGFGGMIDSTESGFVLADGVLGGREVAQLGLLSVRLAVASACQTAVTEIGDLADEAFSVGAALLAAGCACALATLWPVDDLATAMLMTAFYEHLANGQPPATALAAAQRWLRAVDEIGVSTFLSRHPGLAVEHERRHRPNRQVARLGDTRREFSHPVFWAAFVVLGA
jgi:CHAT domain-containing protein/tetratricopeptide (TPR) repeat protein